MKLAITLLSGCLAITAVPVLVVLGLFTLDSCQTSGATLDSAQIVGTWKGDGGARVEFHKDGTFEMTSVPRSTVDDGAMDLPPGKGKLSGKGTWEMSDSDRRTGSIALHFDAAESFSAGTEAALLEVRQAGDSPQIYFDVNPDKHYGYEIWRVRGRYETGAPTRKRSLPGFPQWGAGQGPVGSSAMHSRHWSSFGRGWAVSGRIEGPVEIPSRRHPREAARLCVEPVLHAELGVMSANGQRVKGTRGAHGWPGPIRMRPGDWLGASPTTAEARPAAAACVYGACPPSDTEFAHAARFPRSGCRRPFLAFCWGGRSSFLASSRELRMVGAVGWPRPM